MNGRYDQRSFDRLSASSRQGVLRDLWNRIHRSHGEFRAADRAGVSGQGLVLRHLVQRAGQQVHPLDRRKFEGGNIQAVLQSPRDAWRVYSALLWIADQLQVH